MSVYGIIKIGVFVVCHTCGSILRIESYLLAAHQHFWLLYCRVKILVFVHQRMISPYPTCHSWVQELSLSLRRFSQKMVPSSTHILLQSFFPLPLTHLLLSRWNHRPPPLRIHLMPLLPLIFTRRRLRNHLNRHILPGQSHPLFIFMDELYCANRLLLGWVLGFWLTDILVLRIMVII